MNQSHIQMHSLHPDCDQMRYPPRNLKEFVEHLADTACRSIEPNIRDDITDAFELAQPRMTIVFGTKHQPPTFDGCVYVNLV
jgi:hypothetical protein